MIFNTEVGPEESVPVTEADYNALFCQAVGGELEVIHSYSFGVGSSDVYVDCETAHTVWEGGLDKRTSLDSIQQALFFHYVTGKTPAVVIYDTDGVEGRYEYRIRIAAELAGVRYETYTGVEEITDNPVKAVTGHTLVGDNHANVLSGGAGDDTLVGLAGADQLIGGPGFDSADYSDSNAAVIVRLHSLTAYGGHAHGDSFPETVSVSYRDADGIQQRVSLPDIEYLVGSDFADILAGDRRDNILEGGGGNDILYGGPGGGDDLMRGGAGNDIIYGGIGADSLNGGSGNDLLIGGPGADTFVFAPGHGEDTIRDFANGVDRIDLSGFHLDDNYQPELSLQNDGILLDLTDVNGGAVLLAGLDVMPDGGDFIL